MIILDCSVTIHKSLCIMYCVTVKSKQQTASDEALTLNFLIRQDLCLMLLISIQLLWD